MSSTFRCLSKITEQLVEPLQMLLVNIIILILIDFLKFCFMLLLTFAIGYSIFYLWNNQNTAASGIKTERLSDGLMENGSFSKYPFVVELPIKVSAESIKLKKIL